MSPTLANDLILRLWAEPNTRTAALLLGVALLVVLILPGGKGRDEADVLARQPRRPTEQEDIKRATNTPLLRRLWWKLRPPHDLMRVDGLVIDRTRKPHCAWLGPTGAGKSASVATVRLDGGRVYLAVTPDLSDPLIDATMRLAGFHWTAGISTTAINFLPKRRTPNEVAEYLTEVFRSGGVGAWKRKAYLATAEVVRSIDEANEQRSFGLIAQRLKEKCAKDRELKMVCEGWIGRFESVAEKFGSSAGPHGLDIADLIGRGIPVLLDNDAFRHPGLVEDVIALGLAESKAIADELPDGFRLIFEEAGQLGDRIELAYPFFRAGRRRNIAVDVLTQAETDLKHHGNDAITSNIATHVYFGQGQKSLQQLAADRLGFAPSNMRDFTAWITHDGKINRLVHFPKPPRRLSYETCPTPSPTDTSYGRRATIQEIPVTRPELPRLPPPALNVQEILNSIDRSGHCHLWTGPRDKDGYGYATWNGNNRGVHRIVWELTYGFLPTHDADGNRLEIDHQCRIRHCVKIDHLELITKSENSKRRWRVRGVGTPV